MELKVGDMLSLPFGETGTLVRVNTKTLDWFPYKVRIRKAVFNKTNQVLGFKIEQIKKFGG
jgi:hypothetical protein